MRHNNVVKFPQPPHQVKMTRRQRERRAYQDAVAKELKATGRATRLYGLLGLLLVLAGVLLQVAHGLGWLKW